MIYILSTQALLDAITGHGNMLQWVRSAPSASIEISAVSIGQALEVIEGATPFRRQSLRDALARFVSAADVYQGVVSFDADAARHWARLQQMPLRFIPRGGAEMELGTPSRMVVATALSRGGTLVEEPQPYHLSLSPLAVHSP
jgi:predicted nucleic acid-binding protein